MNNIADNINELSRVNYEQEIEEKQIVDDINLILNKHKKKHISYTDIKWNKRDQKIRWRDTYLGDNTYTSGEDQFRSILLRDAVDINESSKIFYHYLAYEYVHEILEKEKFLFSPLSSYDKSDPSEYNGFMDDVTKFNMSSLYLNKQKKNYFVFCLSNKDNRHLWKECANNHHGVCLGIRFSNFNTKQEISDYYHFREVIYNHNDKLHFITEIQDMLLEKYNSEFLMQKLD